ANAARNGVADRVTVSADLPPAAEPCDLVLANITADVLLRHADDLCRRVRRDAATGPAGRLVLSGLLAADVTGVADAFTQRLGVAPRITARGDWHCLLLVPGSSAMTGAAACRS
ncbi:MAG: 50S ribosomal protein L11 methyltransferase, partial [Planctomycetaceae bacterium]